MPVNPVAHRHLHQLRDTIFGNSGSALDLLHDNANQGALTKSQ
jgi:hypothetical protein